MDRLKYTRAGASGEAEGEAEGAAPGEREGCGVRE
jgi:hypothetical protein